MRGEWPGAGARAFAARLPYARRLAVGGSGAAARASLAGIALAVRALSELLARTVEPREIVFAPGEKPRLARPCETAGWGEAAGWGAAQPGAVELAREERGSLPDFSISHSGPWVGCAALAGGRVGFDVECASATRSRDWVVREAALKATGEGVRGVRAARALEWCNGVIRWRGEPWHVVPLELFPGATACVVSGGAPPAIGARAVTLEELFAR